MIEISPSILSANFANLLPDIELINNSGADYIHVDVMDGVFVEQITIGQEVVKSIKKYAKLPLDVHLMIQNPHLHIESFVNAGSDIITIHYEASPNIIQDLQKIRSLGKKAGVSLKPSTNIDVLKDVLPAVDVILIMTVEPGRGGQKFIASMLEKITQAKKMIIDGKYDTKIEVDGGINDVTGSECINAGADILVSGSYLFNNRIEMQSKIRFLKAIPQISSL